MSLQIALKIQALEKAGDIEKPLLYQREAEIRALADIEDPIEREKLLDQIIKQVKKESDLVTNGTKKGGVKS